MTAQFSDVLLLRDKRHALCATPLEPYLRRLPKARRPVFQTTSTACWRGYVALWQVAGFASEYERDRLLRVENGRVVEEWLRLNPPEPIWYRIEPDGGRARFQEPHAQAAMLDDLFQPDEIPQGYRYWGQPPAAQDDDDTLDDETRLWPPRRFE